MKLTSLAVFFIIIVLPFLFISGNQLDIVKEDAILRSYYDSVIDNAIQDAAFIISQGINKITYDSKGDIQAVKDLAVQTFFDSLYYAFNVYGNPASMARVQFCVPALVFIEEDGFSLYAINSYLNAEYYTVMEHCWFPKKHYIGEILQDRYSVRYTLNDNVYVFDKVNSLLTKGEYIDFKEDISLFANKEDFVVLRNNAIRQSVEKEFALYIEKYNSWRHKSSFALELQFPAMDEEDWLRALNDVGLLVFAQGFPVLYGEKYEHYALGGARVIRKTPIVGYVYKGQPYYCKVSCEFYQDIINMNDENIIYYSNAFEAAQNGYYSCPSCRP
ncbi:MAG: hypothetical protein GX957_13060 [Clostridiaceae bacterium]|nr:hypothetical protein [Clostridiaceae bacterium]